MGTHNIANKVWLYHAAARLNRVVFSNIIYLHTTTFSNKPFSPA
jgi:hypothetical protein